MDAGEWLQSTVTSTSWSILEITNQTMSLRGYLGTDGTICKVVNAVTVAMLPGKMEEVLLVVNNATFVDKNNELESLLQPFQSMKHGVTFHLIPQEYVGREIPFKYDTEKLFLQT